MRVAYFLGKPDRGGMETLVFDLLSSADIASFEMICICREEGNLSEEMRARGVKIFLVPSKKGLDISFLKRLRRQIISEGVEIVHAQHPLEAFYARIALIGSKIPVVETLHGYDYNQTRKGNLIMRFMLKRADLNIYVSKTLRSYYVDKYHLRHRERNVIVYNGVAFEKLDQERVERRGEREEGSRELLLGMVGSFVPIRDQMMVCRFLLLLRERGVSFRFLFIGRRDASVPEYYDNCVEFCERHHLLDRVLFLGVRSDVPEILAQLDAFVYASNHDTFGIAVVEAMAAGVPVFVNDLDVFREVTNNGKWATLYRTGDEHDLLSHFNSFVETPDLFEESVVTAKSEIRERFSIARHLKLLDTIYKNLLIHKSDRSMETNFE